MPTPVSTARQCLTEEAARALDDAVAVAHRRSHAQTTSLHAVSSLLSLPSSTLREACARARSAAYSPRLQFRALELCVNVSLDRVPSSKSLEEPPVSNSLMAAIKRSQANQRRHPETFQFYNQLQQQLQNQSSLMCVKVELKHFILSILDDPIVSRVFGDAGFRSSDIKMATLHPIPPTPISRFPISRCPPLFLCNLPDLESNRRFPFSGFESGDGDCKRIGEVLAKKKGRNPLLIGVCASNALSDFKEALETGKNGFLPAEMDGLTVICLEKEICEFVGGNGSEEVMDLKFKDVRDKVEGCTGTGAVVNYGELKVFLDGGSTDAVNYVVSRLSSLLEVCGGKLWLIGAVGSYETYMKFSAKFPSVEKEWDLSLLPITSSTTSIGGLQSKTSLMGSFVPFAGLFPAPSELESVSSRTNQSISCCNLCNKKYENEVSIILKGGSTLSIADQHSASVASWLPMRESDASKTIVSTEMQAKDHGSILNAKLVGLQRKWNDICQRLHHSQSPQPAISQVKINVPCLEGFQFDTNEREKYVKDSLVNESSCTNLGPCIHEDTQEISLPKEILHLPVSSEAEEDTCQHKRTVDFFPVTEHMNTSSSSVVSVTTDLGLGTIYASSETEQRQLKLQDHKDRLQNFSGSVSAEVDWIASNQIAKSIQCPGPELIVHSGENNFKHLCSILREKVGWQDNAIFSISQTISRCRTGNGRRRGSSHSGDIWLTFLGPDKIGKRKIAAALAEIVSGSMESLIYVDLNSENGICHSDSTFNCHDLKLSDVKLRGKTPIDYIALELRKKPHSVVLLENVDNADFLAQSSLSRAIRTGKLQDTDCREISINNTIFVTTSNSIKVEEHLFPGKGLFEYSEERILGAKGLKMKIAVESNTRDVTGGYSSNVLLMPRKSTSSFSLVHKRKLIETCDFEILVPAIKMSKSCFDLNLPVEETEGNNFNGNIENDSVSEAKEVWFDDFLNLVDEKVIFKPFDFDALAQKILGEIGLSFQKAVGSDVRLEIETEVLVQILASSWLSDRKREVEDWIETVLCKGFLEAKQAHCINAQSVVKLVAVQGCPLDGQAFRVCLPDRIILN